MTAPAPVLALLAGRYGAGARGRDIAPEADGVVRAMPVVLRIERDPLPVRTALLEAAATAALAVCTDPRAQPGGEWHDAVAPWVDGRIRKIARRARGAHWRAVAELPGVTVRVGDAEARALLLGPVDGVPKVVARLQIGGTELPADEPGPPDPDAPLVLLSPHAEMTVGKAAAQVGHATMLLGAAAGWPVGAAPVCAVRAADPATWARMAPAADDGTDGVVGVRDAGFTEVDPGTMTCLAVAHAAFAAGPRR
ncbi:peptidyl-tRNA hydrolase [Pseudonocardia sp. HH130629-09]|uniref:peptidyl-tRNA hydrolase n=1 Tax=Pseudonocardia sp. HH130629-09 TaxID=1641402 RepID=UPI000760D50E|nr:peptidyl-tRNA hydrolase [Pseudonocardia sp. HH130629-09]